MSPASPVATGRCCPPRPAALRGAEPRAVARAFTLLEVLLAIALLGSLLVALNVFVFSMAEIWGAGRDERLFAQHARAVSRHVEDLLQAAARGPAGGGVEVKEVRLESGGEAPRITFTLAEGDRLLVWPEQALPDVEMALGVVEGEGLRLQGRSRLELDPDTAVPRGSLVSPFVTSIGWDYYDESFRRWETLDAPKSEMDGSYPLPRRLRLRFAHGDLKLERVLRVPGPVEGATRP